MSKSLYTIIALLLTARNAASFSVNGGPNTARRTFTHFGKTQSSGICRHNGNANTHQDALFSSTRLNMATEEGGGSNLPMLLDPGTKGGALFLSLVLFLVPIGIYEFGTLVLGWDGIDAGRYIGVGFVVFTTVLWTATYILRVATKDMTYVSLGALKSI